MTMTDRQPIKSPDEIARAHFEDDGSDLSKSVIASVTAAIRQDREQILAAIDAHKNPVTTNTSAAAMDQNAGMYLAQSIIRGETW